MRLIIHIFGLVIGGLVFSLSLDTDFAFLSGLFLLLLVILFVSFAFELLGELLD